jgi:hypothetical protein
VIEREVGAVRCHGLAACLCADVTTAPGTLTRAGQGRFLHLYGSIIQYFKNSFRTSQETHGVCVGFERLAAVIMKSTILWESG